MRANTLVVLLVAIILALSVAMFASVMSLSSQRFQIGMLNAGESGILRAIGK